MPCADDRVPRACWTRERARNSARRARPTSVEERKRARRARKQRRRHGKRPECDRQQHRGARQHAGRRGQRDECHLPQPWRVKKRTNYDLVTASRGPVTRRRTSATCHVASPTPAPRQGTYQLQSGNGQQVPGNAPEDVGNVPGVISHRSSRHEQHRGSDLPHPRSARTTSRPPSPTAPVDVSNIAMSHSPGA